MKLSMTSPVARTVAAIILVLSHGPAALGADDRTLAVITHDAFFLPEEVIEAFQFDHGAEVRLLRVGDAGAMVSQAILTADRPLADVMYGVDNTFLSRAVDAGIFLPYESPSLETVSPEFRAEGGPDVTPIDYADVCLNIDQAFFSDRGLAPPDALEDLVDPANRGLLVVQDPSLSSPGFAFLLSTIAYFGDDPETGWQAFWRRLRENDVFIASGWTEAYYSRFSGVLDGGDRPIVVSYGSSPVAEVDSPDTPRELAPTAAVEAGCFRQVEYAGVLAGTEEPELAGAFIDFLLTPEVQAQLPWSMFVYPVVEGVPLPEAFERHAIRPIDPLEVPPEQIEAGRDRWIDEWLDIVLR